MILQAIPEVSTNAWYYTAMPLSAMISLGMAKEFLADYKRYKMDKTSNGLPTRRLNGGLSKATKDNRFIKQNSSFKNESQSINISLDKTVNLSDHYRLACDEVRTDELMVGDIIKVMDDEIVPADCFLLTSGVGAEDPEANG